MSDDQSRGRRTQAGSREHRGEESAKRRPRDDSEQGLEEPRQKVLRRDDETPSTSRARSGSGNGSGNGSGGDRGAGEQGGRTGRRDETPSTSRARSGSGNGSGNGSGGDRGAGEQGGRTGRRDRNRFELVKTRPQDVVSKKGAGGQSIPLQANYFRLLTTPTWQINQYHVVFEPEIEMRRLRAGILSEHRTLFGGYLYDGLKLFACNRLREDLTVLNVTSKAGQAYKITLKFVGIVEMTDAQSLQVLNLILRRSMSGLKLQLVGRNFFDSQAKIDLRDFRMQLWPGYETSIRKHEQDILLCAEIQHKVMRMETVYDILQKSVQNSRDYREDFRRQVLGLTVLTDYNNKTYRINDVDFEKTPNHKFSCKGKDISFVDYYLEKYNIRIRDPHQPLLISKAKESSVRGGASDTVVLIPEFARATGLTDSMRANFQLMRAMADHTRMNPDRRIDRLRIFNQRLQNTPDSVNVLRDWNMSLERELVQLEGRILEPQRIVFADGRKVQAGEEADWTREFRNQALLTTPSRGLERWSVIGTQRSSRDLRNFVESLIRAAGGMRMRISRPREVLLYDDRNHSYMQAMDDCARDDPQLILCLVPNNNAERYSSVKRKACLERGVPTQVITQKTAGNQRGLMSIATKVAIQINCKLGYSPWTVNIPLAGLMTIGYDVAKSTRDRSKAFGALVATMDLRINTSFYSTVAECSSHDVLANSLWPMMTKALRQYRSEYRTLPARILFYRDGVGEGSLEQVYEHEVKDIVEKLETEYRRSEAEKPPMFAYVVVTKNMNTRFFHQRRNPPPGTVVDDVVTLPERYDFFLVSQSVRQGTVSPTSYNIVYSSIGLSPEKMQLLTYKMTHLYFNWSGTTRVPAVCQYAKKLATLVATCLHQPSLNSLERKLFYL